MCLKSILNSIQPYDNTVKLMTTWEYVYVSSDRLIEGGAL